MLSSGRGPGSAKPGYGSPNEGQDACGKRQAAQTGTGGLLGGGLPVLSGTDHSALGVYDDFISYIEGEYQRFLLLHRRNGSGQPECKGMLGPAGVQGGSCAGVGECSLCDSVLSVYTSMLKTMTAALSTVRLDGNADLRSTVGLVVVDCVRSCMGMIGPGAEGVSGHGITNDPSAAFGLTVLCALVAVASVLAHFGADGSRAGREAVGLFYAAKALFACLLERIVVRDADGLGDRSFISDLRLFGVSLHDKAIRYLAPFTAGECVGMAPSGLFGVEYAVRALSVLVEDSGDVMVERALQVCAMYSRTTNSTAEVCSGLLIEPALLGCTAVSLCGYGECRCYSGVVACPPKTHLVEACGYRMLRLPLPWINHVTMPRYFNIVESFVDRLCGDFALKECRALLLNRCLMWACSCANIYTECGDGARRSFGIALIEAHLCFAVLGALRDADCSTFADVVMALWSKHSTQLAVLSRASPCNSSLSVAVVLFNYTMNYRLHRNGRLKGQYNSANYTVLRMLDGVWYFNSAINAAWYDNLAYLRGDIKPHTVALFNSYNYSWMKHDKSPNLFAARGTTDTMQCKYIHAVEEAAESEVPNFQLWLDVSVLHDYGNGCPYGNIYYWTPSTRTIAPVPCARVSGISCSIVTGPFKTLLNTCRKRCLSVGPVARLPATAELSVAKQLASKEDQLDSVGLPSPLVKNDGASSMTNVDVASTDSLCVTGTASPGLRRVPEVFSHAVSDRLRAAAEWASEQLAGDSDVQLPEVLTAGDLDFDDDSVMASALLCGGAVVARAAHKKERVFHPAEHYGAKNLELCSRLLHEAGQGVTDQVGLSVGYATLYQALKTHFDHDKLANDVDNIALAVNADVNVDGTREWIGGPRAHGPAAMRWRLYYNMCRLRGLPGTRCTPDVGLVLRVWDAGGWAACRDGHCLRLDDAGLGGLYGGVLLHDALTWDGDGWTVFDFIKYGVHSASAMVCAVLAAIEDAHDTSSACLRATASSVAIVSLWTVVSRRCRNIRVDMRCYDHLADDDSMRSIGLVGVMHGDSNGHKCMVQPGGSYIKAASRIARGAIKIEDMLTYKQVVTTDMAMYCALVRAMGFRVAGTVVDTTSVAEVDCSAVADCLLAMSGGMLQALTNAAALITYLCAVPAAYYRWNTYYTQNR